MPNRWVQDDPSEEHPLLLEGGWPGPAAPSEHRRPVTKSDVAWQACTTQPPPAYAPTTHAFIAFMGGAAPPSSPSWPSSPVLQLPSLLSWPSSPAQLRPPSLPSWPSSLARPPALPSWPPMLVRPPC